MTDMRQQTINTYNQSAELFAEYFRSIGPRSKYIDAAIKAAGNPQNPRILEIGCGDGRDAKEIVKLTDKYVGIDVSTELIKLARSYVPNATFEVADAVTYAYPSEIDVVFSFASVLHLDRTELEELCMRISAALRPGGVFYVSSKWSETYREAVKDDQYGSRLFHFYNAELVSRIAGNTFERVNDFREQHGNAEWFELTLRKL